MFVGGCVFVTSILFFPYLNQLYKWPFTQTRPKQITVQVYGILDILIREREIGERNSMEGGMEGREEWRGERGREREREREGERESIN